MPRMALATDLGADPLGVADSTAAINNALANCGRVYLPDGTYKLTGTLNVPDQGALVGDGPGGAILNCVGMGAVPAVALCTNKTGVGVVSRQRLAGLRVSGTCLTAFDFRGSQYFSADDLHVAATCTDGVMFGTCWGFRVGFINTQNANISNACVNVGASTNAGVVTKVETGGSTRSTYCLLVDGATGIEGLTFEQFTAQASVYGVWAAQCGGVKIGHLYAEQVVHPVRVGDKANSKIGSLHLGRASVFGVLNTMPSYDQRRACVWLDYSYGSYIGPVKYYACDVANTPNMLAILYNKITNTLIEGGYATAQGAAGSIRNYIGRTGDAASDSKLRIRGLDRGTIGQPVDIEGTAGFSWEHVWTERASGTGVVASNVFAPQAAVVPTGVQGLPDRSKTMAKWTSGGTVAVGDILWADTQATGLSTIQASGQNVYKVTAQTGALGTTMPSHTSGSAANGGATLLFMGVTA